MYAYLIFNTSFNFNFLPFIIALINEIIIKMSKTENDTLGTKVYKGNLLIASPEFSVKKPPGNNEMIIKNANQK